MARAHQEPLSRECQKARRRTSGNHGGKIEDRRTGGNDAPIERLNDQKTAIVERFIEVRRRRGKPLTVLLAVKRGNRVQFT